MVAHVSWVLGTVFGVVAGRLISDVEGFGIDYALPAMFIALLVLQMTSPVLLLVAAAGGGIAVALALAGIAYWNVVIATIAAATFGLGASLWTSRTSS